MDKKDFVLNVFSLLPDNHPYLSPIKVQKLFFLIEKRLGKDGTYFNFQPYLYGPYDSNLKAVITELVKDEKMEIEKHNNLSLYKIVKRANTDNFLTKAERDYIQCTLIPFVLQKSFRELCFAIYNEFPEMKVNSVLVQE